jgi:hypothetical protein
MPSTVLSDPPTNWDQPSVLIDPSIEPSLSIQPSITDLCSPGNNFCHKDAIYALEAPSDAGSKDYSCTCKDGYTGDGYFYPCLWYDEECANEYPCAPPKQGGYCEDRAPNAPILHTKYAYGCCNGFTPGAELAKEGCGPLSCIDFDECVSTQDNGEPVHNCDSEHGICTNTVGSFTCFCEERFTGDGTTCTEILPLPVLNPILVSPILATAALIKSARYADKLNRRRVSAHLGSSLPLALEGLAKASTNVRTTPRITAMQTLAASNWMAASTVYAKLASLEMVGLVQTKTSVPTRASSSVIQMLNVSTRLAPTVVSASRVTMETETHASIWTNVR